MRILLGMFLFLSLSNFLIAQNNHSKIFKTTPDELEEMFSENELAAKEKLDGKLVEITGIVASIGKTMGSPYINLKLSKTLWPAVMFIKDSEEKALMKLRKGQTISVICKEISYVISPSGENCSIKK